MSRAQFKAFVKKTLKLATTSKDESVRLNAIKLLGAMALAAEFARKSA